MVKSAPSPIVWITGTGGLIGHHLLHTAAKWAPQYRAVGSTRSDVDLTKPPDVREAFQRIRPSVVIHCAAMTKSEACEEAPQEARRVNVEATVRLADLARDIPFLFLSTDLVFDGSQGWYDETAAPNPLNLYGLTKVEAERHILSNPRHSVVRTSLNSGRSPTGNRSFNEEMRAAWRAGRTLTLFTDEFRCPLPAVITAHALWELLQRGQPGLYHLAGAERLSRWQLGELLAKRYAEINPKLVSASRREYSGPPRPADTSLNCAKVQSLLSFSLPRFSTWVATAPPGAL